MGNLDKDYHFYRDQFDTYYKALNSSKELPKTVLTNDVKVSKAASALMKAYYHIGRYEKLKGSEASKALDELLANKHFSKKFPKKILLYKLEKFLIDIYNKGSSKGLLAHPKGVINHAPPLSEELFSKLGMPSPDFKIERNDYTLRGVVDVSADIMRLDVEGKNGKALKFKVTVDNSDLVIHQVNTHEPLLRLPLEETFAETLLDKLTERIEQGSAYPSNAVLLDKMGILTLPFETTFKGVDYHISKAGKDNSSLMLTGKLGDGKESSFLVTNLDDKVVLRKLIDGQADREIDVSNLNNFTLESLLRGAAPHLGFAAERSKELKENQREIHHPSVIKALKSHKISVFMLEREAESMPFNPKRKISDYPEKDIQKFLNRSGSLDVNYTPNMTIRELIQKVANSKTPIRSEVGLEAMLFFLERLPETARLKKSDEKFLETYKERIKEQLVFKQTEYVKLLDYPDQAPELCAKLAGEFLYKTNTPKYREIGPFINAGWETSAGSHFTNVELLKTGDVWQFRVADTGVGEKLLGKIDVIKIFETKDRKEAQKIVADLLLFSARKQTMEEPSKAFYSIFEQAEHIRDYSVAALKAGTPVNHAVKNQEEAFLDVSRRHQRLSLAQEYIYMKERNLAAAAAPYPLLQKDLKRIGAPFLHEYGKGDITLVEGRLILGKAVPSKEKHRLHFKDRGPTTIFHTETYKAKDAKKMLILQEHRNKFLMQYSNESDFKIYRNDQLVAPSSNKKIALKKGDTIVMSQYTFTVE